ncbi:MAG TPA: hypothetical protein VK070_11010 [Acidimicrobiia bacterium]|nr:hypothetical protein [Acidimicrobiia bacterium]
MRPRSRRGAFVVLVGPDGVGKTSIARELLSSHGGCTGYVHFRPPILRPLSPSPEPGQARPTEKRRQVGRKPIGILRLLLSVLAFGAGYLTRVLPAIRRGCLVVGDRWSYGYIVQPVSLGFFGPEPLARLALRLMPKPDLLVALEAPVEVIRERKQELTEDEILAEMRLARALTSPSPLVVDASDEASTVADLILAALGMRRGGV